MNQAHFIERTIHSVLDQRGEFELDYRVLDGAVVMERYQFLSAMRIDCFGPASLIMAKWTLSTKAYAQRQAISSGG
jgi:hypothetical protein